jgi:hypothetical protein
MIPRFYSKTAIGWLTVILSPFLGGILFSFNLREVGKGKYSLYFIVVGMFWMLIFRKLTEGFIPNTLIQLLLGNVIGALLLTSFFWDKYLGEYPVYEKKPFWKQALIFLAVCILFILIPYFLSRIHY